MFDIPLSRPEFGEAEEKALTGVLRSGAISKGAWIDKLEEIFRKNFGVKYAIAVSSGFAALQVALEACDIDKEREGQVCIPAMTFPAVPNAILAAGCRPVFSDIDAESGNILPDDIPSSDQIGGNLGAAIMVHHAGHPVDVSKIPGYRRPRYIIEDCAHALGSSFEGTQVGTMGHIGCFSFWASKAITTGEGGMIITDLEQVAERARLLISHGIDKSHLPWERRARIAGHNFRMSNLTAALGVVQMERLDDLIVGRREAASFYMDLLQDIEEIRLPYVNEKEFEHSFHLFQIRVPQAARNGLVYYLRNQGIEASVHYSPILPDQAPYVRSDCPPKRFPGALAFSKETVSLPIWPLMSENPIKKVVSEIRRFFGK